MTQRLGLFKRLRLGSKLMQPLSDEERGVLGKLLPGGYKTTPYRGVRGMLTAYSKSPWVRAIVSKIGDAVGSTKWMLFAVKGASGKYVADRALQAKGIDTRALALGGLDFDGELVPIVDHPALRLLNSANPLFPGLVGRTQTQISMDLTGEAHWLLSPEDYGGTAVPERFWLLPSHWVQGMPTSGDDNWDVQTPFWRGKFPAQAILRFVNPDPINPYGRGSAIFRAFGDEIDTDEYAAQHVKSWFLNKARPDLLITGEGLTEKDTERMEVAWLQQMRGFLRAHKPFFINRKVDVREISQRFADMQLTDLRKWERDIIVHGIGAPPEILGIVENSNRSTIDAADYLWSRWVITPRLDLMRAFLQYQLLPIYDDRLILAYQSPVSEDRAYQLDVMKANPPAFSVNDWREQAEFEPREDGDVNMIPYNVRIVDSLAPEPVVRLSVRTTPPLFHLSDDLSDGLGCGHAEASSSHASRGVLPSILGKQVGGPETTGLALKLSPGMQKEIIAAFKAVRDSIDYRALMAAFDAGNIQAALAIIEGADLPAAFEDARQILRQAVVVVGEEAAKELGAYLGTTLNFEMTNPEAVAFLESVGADMLDNVTDDVIEAARKILTDAYADGHTSQEAAKLLREKVGLTTRDLNQLDTLQRAWEDGGASAAEIQELTEKWTEGKIRYRAQLIADNELVEAGNRGQRALWDQAASEGLIPAEAKRRWIVTPDDALCVLCAPMDGVEVGFTELYQTDVGAVMVPNQIHVRCRCSEMLVLKK